MEVILHPAYLVKKHKERRLGFDIRYYVENEDFTGILVMYELDGTCLKGRRYEDGALTGELFFNFIGSQILNQRSSVENRSELNSKAYPKVEYITGPPMRSCKQDKECKGSAVCVGGLCMLVFNLAGVTVTADAPKKNAPSFNDWLSGAGPITQQAASPMPIGWPVTYIKNNVSDPCMKSVVNEIINNNVEDALIKKANDIFKNNNTYNIVYKNKADYVVDKGKDFPSGSAATVYNENNRNGGLNITIYIDNDVLKNSANEYVAATVLHEIVHGLQYVDGQDIEVQHNLMVLQGYPDKIAAALKKLFPTLSNEDAELLSWEGYDETDAFKAVVKKNGKIWDDQITEVNVKYRKGYKGTKCN